VSICEPAELVSGAVLPVEKPGRLDFFPEPGPGLEVRRAERRAAHAASRIPSDPAEFLEIVFKAFDVDAHGHFLKG